MELLFSLFFLLSGSTLAQSASCFAPAPCECWETIASCICNSRQDFVLRMDWINAYYMTEIYISGCGTVKLKDLATEYNYFDSVQLVNISSLVIEMYSFSRVESVASLLISDIEDLQIQSQAFSGLNNLTSIVLKNVRVNRLRKELFRHVSHVEEFQIQDSVFNIAESKSLLLDSVRFFKISNSKFNALESTSIMIHSSQEVSFINSHFLRTEVESFFFTLVDKVEFKNCTFGVLNSIVTGSIGSFTLSNSTVALMETNALLEVRARDDINLHHNSIEAVQNNSLLPENYAVVSFSDNRFGCNCTNSWLWKHHEEIYATLLNSSRCIGNESITLYSITPHFTPEGKCVSVITSLDAETFSHDMLLSNESARSKAYLKESNLFIVGILWQFLFLIECLQGTEQRLIF